MSILHLPPTLLFLIILTITSILLPLGQARSTITLSSNNPHRRSSRGNRIRGFYGRDAGRRSGSFRARQEGGVGDEGVGNTTSVLNLVVPTADEPTGSSSSTTSSASSTTISSSISLTAPSFEDPVPTPAVESSTTSSSTSSPSSSSTTASSPSEGLTPYVYTGPTWSAVYTISTSSSSQPEPTSIPAEPESSESSSSLEIATTSTTEDESTSFIVVPTETTIVPTGQSGSVGISTLFFTSTSTSNTDGNSLGTPTITPTQPISSGTSSGLAITTTTAPPGATSTSPTRTTHTVVINPTEGIKKMIPFVLTARPGDRLGFIVYGDEGSSGSSVSTSESGAGIGVGLVGPGCQPIDGGEVGMEEVDGVFEVEVKPDEKGRMIFGSTELGDCLGGMILLVNVQDGDESGGDETQPDESLTFGEIKVDGSTVRQAVTTWGTQNLENFEALRSFQSSEQMNPRAWGWGEESTLSGLEELGVGLDGMVQNVLYTRLTLALNPSLLEAYTTNNSASTNPYSPKSSTTTSGMISIITELTAHPTFLPGTEGMESTTEVYGGNAQGTASLGYGRSGGNGCVGVARVSKVLLGVGVGLAGLLGLLG